MKMKQQKAVIDTAVEEGKSLSREAATQAIVTQTLPAGYISERKGRGGKAFTYIKHGRVVQILNEAFGFQWSFEALPSTLRELKDGGYGIFGRLTVYIGGEQITKIELGTKDFMPGMLDGDLMKSAVSDALRRCAMRLGVALELYLQDDELTANQVMTQLCTFAKNKGWTPDQVRAFLKNKGYTAEDLVAMQNDAYRDLAAEIGKSKTEDLDPEPERETATEEELDPLVEMAKEKLGAVVKGKKINFITLYAESEERFGFGSTKTKAVLLSELGKDWYYLDKQKLVATLEKAKNV